MLCIHCLERAWESVIVIGPFAVKELPKQLREIDDDLGYL